MLSAVLRRGALGLGLPSSSWAQSRGVRRGSDRCQQRNQGQMEAGAMICLEVRMFSSLKEAAP